MNFPENLKYTKDHEWIRVEAGGVAYIGITDFAQSELGDIVYVEVETLDEELSAEEEFGVVEAVKTTSDLFMPIDGKVLEFNPELDPEGEDNPAIINSDPYGKGWIVKIEITDPSQLDGLLDAATYQKEIQ